MGSEVGGKGGGGREAIIGIANGGEFLEGEDPDGDRVGFTSDRTPKDALASNRFIQESTEEVGAEVGVRFGETLQVGSGEKVEDEPIVTLTENLDGDAAGLLGYEDRTEVIFAAFFDPGDVGLRGDSAFDENRLGLFDYCDGDMRN